MDRVLQDLRHAARMLARTPVFTLVIIFTLAVGIGANTAMFSVVNAVLLQSLPFKNADRIVDINEVEKRQRNRGAIAPANFVDWRAQAASFESMSLYSERNMNVATAGGEPERVSGAATSTTFFDVLGAEPVLGRAFQRGDAEPGQSNVVVLGYGLWQRRFAGAANVVGQSMRINGAPYTIVGVMPATVTFPARAELWVASTYDLPPGGGGDPRENRGMHYLRGVARLKSGVTVAAGNAELDTIGQQLARAYPDTNSNFVPVVTPLQDVLVRSARTPLLVLLGAVLCVLLIVVANVANLLMARATVRSRELAIRAALGAGRQVLIRQLLTESVLLAIVGGAFGVLLAFWGVDLILALEPGEIPRVAPIAVNGQALSFAVGLSVITGLLFGVVPAWQASRPELQNTLKDATRGTTGDGHRHLARMGLVLAEVALSLVLLVGAGLLFRSLMNLLNVPLGFSSSQITTMQVAPTGEGYRSPEQAVAYWERVLERVQAVPGVEKVALTNSMPMSGNIGILSYSAEGKPQLPPNQSPLSHFASVSPSYFTLLGIPVLQGHEFTASDAVINPRAIVVNEAMARREWPGENAIGKRITFGPPDPGSNDPEWLEVVGVVGNIRQYGVDQEPVPTTYVPHTSAPTQALTIMVRSAGDPSSVAGSVRAALQGIDSSLPISRLRPLDEVIGASLTQRRFNMTLLAVFAGIALVLAIAGIYGTVSYAVAQRTQELGIRSALGATRADVLRLVLFDGLKPVALGLALGIAGAFVLRRSLDRLVYGVTTSDPATFIALPTLLAVVAVIASLVPALRAAKVDPMTALRVE
ncbi:MAG TPA: ABC transporter permease [Vicinamibacterales bacterium]|nr:ABC transporter permease [Vicinamibacterales bacterium]